MKKQSLLLVTAAMLVAASCNTETGNDDAAQAKIDSMVNARVDEIRIELKAKNDSIINELATWRADSIINAMKGKKVVKRKPKPQPPGTKEKVQQDVAVKPAEKPTTSSSKWGKEGNGGETSKSKWGTEKKEGQEGETSKSKWGN